MRAEEQIAAATLFDNILASGAKLMTRPDGYELVECHGIEVLSKDGKYVPVVCVSRHKTIKHLVELTVKADVIYSVTVTTDHVCMILDRDRVLQPAAAKDLEIGNYALVYDPASKCEVLGEITMIKDLGSTADYVYDLEVDAKDHIFYANDVLIHNSQFINLEPLTNWMIAKYDLPQKISEWPQEKRKELWDTLSDFVNVEVNSYVRNLVKDYCKTTQSNVLTYELEYMVDVGLYESKKHYFVHKIFEEGDAVDKAKVTGISLKKNETDKSMKNFLKDIYEGVVIKDWTEHDYQDYISSLYEKFKQFSIDEVSFWKGYGTSRDSIGFLQMAKGATQISRACTYYNHIIAKMGLGKQYDTLRVGDKCRFTYIKPTNKYGIECIAYKPGSWPKEFNEIFEVDYSTMFDKIILDQLKRFREACQFEDIDPRKQVMQDVFEL